MVTFLGVWSPVVFWGCGHLFWGCGQLFWGCGQLCWRKNWETCISGRDTQQLSINVAGRLRVLIKFGLPPPAYSASPRRPWTGDRGPPLWRDVMGLDSGRRCAQRKERLRAASSPSPAGHTGPPRGGSLQLMFVNDRLCNLAEAVPSLALTCVSTHSPADPGSVSSQRRGNDPD